MKSKEKVLHCVKVEPERPAYKYTVDNTLQALQHEVGGLIECLDVSDGITFIVNKEDKLDGLRANRRVSGDIIAGTFLIVGTDYKTGEFTSLPPEQIAWWIEWFSKSEDIDQSELEEHIFMYLDDE
ncbi:MAG TPA: DUF3846 domain-containing protein [Saprospiraceae bacterium]|nr:DUF3846 domain-containing protein [Saprospiraceae bacterium]